MYVVYAPATRSKIDCQRGWFYDLDDANEWAEYLRSTGVDAQVRYEEGAYIEGDEGGKHSRGYMG